MTDDEHIAKFYPIYLLKDSRRVQLEICRKIVDRVFSLLSVEKIKDASRAAGDKYILDLRLKKHTLICGFRCLLFIVTITG